LNVSVVSGGFNVSLEFGAGAFTGANRFLEIAVRPAGGGAFTTLAPRQPILSTPYSIKSLSAATADNSAQLGGVDSSRFVQQDAGGNSFFGKSAGAQTMSGSLNMFAGFEAGIGNMTGSNNAFVGTRTGEFDTTGGNNTFIGAESGRANSNGSNNTFIGYNAQGNIGNNLTNVTAIGANAAVLQSNSLVLGSINGVNNATADTKVGIDTTAPKAKLEVTGGNILVGSPGQGIILKSPNGATCHLLSIDNAGVMVLTTIACP
jgi:hypothetical protein